MKTPVIFRENLDEIVFTGRNRDYGAYEIRKKYDKSLSIAMGISTGIALIAISIPLVANYYNHERQLGGTGGITVVMENLEPPPVTPPPPPPAAEIPDSRENRFVPPEVTDDGTTTDDYGNQDELLRQDLNQPLDTVMVITEITRPQPVIEEPKTSEVFTVVEEMPYYPGGDEARFSFLRNNLRYPEVARTNGIEGTVYIEFVVEKTGKITQVQVRKGIGGGCDEEAARVVGLMPWIPGRQGGKNVDVRFTIPIRFVLRS